MIDLHISTKRFDCGLLIRSVSRSAEDAAGDKPGIGLGLVQSRETARNLGGDLNIDCRA